MLFSLLGMNINAVILLPLEHIPFHSVKTPFQKKRFIKKSWTQSMFFTFHSANSFRFSGKERCILIQKRESSPLGILLNKNNSFSQPDQHIATPCYYGQSASLKKSWTQSQSFSIWILIRISNTSKFLVQVNISLLKKLWNRVRQIRKMYLHFVLLPMILYFTKDLDSHPERTPLYLFLIAK